MIDDKTRAEVRRLFFAEHWKVGTIAAQIGLHHATVKGALDLADPPKPDGPRPTTLDKYEALVRDTLNRYPSLVATRVAGMLRERGWKGGDSAVRRWIKRRRAAPGARPRGVLPPDHPAGRAGPGGLSPTSAASRSRAARGPCTAS